MGVFGFANEDAFDSLIWSHGQGANVDPLLIKAVIAQESGFRPQAQRPEPRLNDASRGLMQILYATARGIGYVGSPDGLFDPDTNILYGTAYLSQQLMRYGGDMFSAAAAYNAGSARRGADGSFVNQSYVDGVERYYLGYVNDQASRGGGAGPVPDVLRDAGGSGPPADTSISGLFTSIVNLFAPSDAQAEPEPSVTPEPDWTYTPAAGSEADIFPADGTDSILALLGVALIGMAILAPARGR